MTVAASKNAPPNIDALILTCVIIGAMISGLLLGVVYQDSIFGMIFPGIPLGMGLSIVAMTYYLMKGPSDAQKAAEERYARQWYCRRCGCLFHVEQSAEGTAPVVHRKGWWTRTLFGE